MDITDAQAKISGGFQKLGTRLGTKFVWFQPQGPHNPLNALNQRGNYLSYFDRSNRFTGREAAEFGKPEYYVAYSRSGPSIGSYLVSQNSDGSPQDIYFIADQAALTPSKVLKCNKTVSFYRTGDTAATSGGVAEPEPDDGSDDPFAVSNLDSRPNGGQGTLIAANWPVAVIPGTKGEKDTLNVPESTRMPWIDIKAPPIPGVVFQTGDRFEDENGDQWKISLPLMDIGCWHLTAELVKVN